MNLVFGSRNLDYVNEETQGVPRCCPGNLKSYEVNINLFDRLGVIRNDGSSEDSDSNQTATIVARFENEPHLRDLITLLCTILLINADSINPYQ